MKYCQSCGASVSLKVPEGDNRERHVCTTCGDIHYQNPKIVAGCLPVRGDKVLLCRRAINPRYNFWTLPAGFMENGETLEQAAIRESMEEANAVLDNLRLYTVISLPHIDQVYMMFLADLQSEDFYPGEESLETRLFSENEIPWDELAFRTIHRTLEIFFRERKQGHFGIHNSTIDNRNR
jgi:ADP-ribose pyrophosphatase YjhB (NUDIX family)